MRNKLIAGNWKMNLGPRETGALIAALRVALEKDGAAALPDREILVAPPFVSLAAAADALQGSMIELGAQNMHFEDKGAFTGEVSAPMLKQLGVTWVIIGHSERRHLFGEQDDFINQKIKSALNAGLKPILCVGEKLDEREAGRTLDIVLAQLMNGLSGLEDAEITRVTIAYEPVWAIGTGKTASPEQAQMVHGAIRGSLDERASRPAAQAMRILYGGSVTPENVDSLLSKPDIDGALVGGASLKADSFARIVRAKVS